MIVMWKIYIMIEIEKKTAVENMRINMRCFPHISH